MGTKICFFTSENIDIIDVLDLLVECFYGIPFLRDHKFRPNGMNNEYQQFNGICTIDKCTMDQWKTLVINLQAENSNRLKTTKPALKLQKTKPKNLHKITASAAKSKAENSH